MGQYVFIGLASGQQEPNEKEQAGFREGSVGQLSCEKACKQVFGGIRKGSGQGSSRFGGFGQGFGKGSGQEKGST